MYEYKINQRAITAGKDIPPQYSGDFLFVLIINIPVNNFSVISGEFLGCTST